MVRKILLLTLDDQVGAKTAKARVPNDSLIICQVPSFMHVASIMNEVTSDEKENFGRVNLKEALEEQEGFMKIKDNTTLTE